MNSQNIMIYEDFIIEYDDDNNENEYEDLIYYTDFDDDN